MKERIRTVVSTLLVLLVLVAGGALWVLYSGSYNVAATAPHWGVTRWALSTLQHESVADRAGGVVGAPPTDSAAIDHGFQHFHGMCVQCHGAPGLDRGEIGQGIRPVPPRLEEEAAEWTDAELFWITKHGIRLAGMPAFGPTHSDSEIWGIVGFIRRMEAMTEEEYAERVRALGATEDGAAHGPPGHEH